MGHFPRGIQHALRRFEAFPFAGSPNSVQLMFFQLPGTPVTKQIAFFPEARVWSTIVSSLPVVSTQVVGSCLHSRDIHNTMLSIKYL